MTDQSQDGAGERLPDLFAPAELPALPQGWQTRPLRAEATAQERAFVVWLRRVLGRIPAPSQGGAARRMGIDGALLSRLLQGERVSAEQISRLCEGVNRVWGREGRPVVTADEQLEGLALVVAVLEAKPVRPSAQQVARRKAEEAQRDLALAATVRTRLEARLAAAEEQVERLQRILVDLEGAVTITTVEEVEVLAQTRADLAGTRAELADAKHRVLQLELDLEQARQTYERAESDYKLRQADLKAAVQIEVQEALRIREQLSGTQTKLLQEQADRAQEKIRKLERDLRALQESGTAGPEAVPAPGQAAGGRVGEAVGQLPGAGASSSFPAEWSPRPYGSQVLSPGDSDLHPLAVRVHNASVLLRPLMKATKVATALGQIVVRDWIRQGGENWFVVPAVPVALAGALMERRLGDLVSSSLTTLQWSRGHLQDSLGSLLVIGLLGPMVLALVPFVLTNSIHMAFRPSNWSWFNNNIHWRPWRIVSHGIIIAGALWGIFLPNPRWATDRLTLQAAAGAAVFVALAFTYRVLSRLWHRLGPGSPLRGSASRR
ncbi:hypothetical protein [Kitasatospora indigofera]|uniref:hypothetical protein n=1 Tax=Kitasatospora indigofera TaxID=67307 RepID=UPI0036BA197F